MHRFIASSGPAAASDATMQTRLPTSNPRAENHEGALLLYRNAL